MGKYYGKVGYVIPLQTAPGVYQDSEPIEKPYVCETKEEHQRWVGGNQVNDNLKVRTTVEIIADPFAITHFSKIKYCEYMGILWTVTDVLPRYPRLVLTLGGEYNG